MPISHFAHRHRKAIWTIALIIVPLLILGAGTVVEHLLIPKESMTFRHYAETTTIALLCGASAWLINQGLRIFLWEDAYVRLTEMSAPAVIQGAGSVTVYTIAILVILIAILNLDLSAVLLSTGLVAAVLGVAMQNTITDFVSGMALGIDKPYRIGDWVEFEDGTIGEVIDITWRSTRIQSWNASLYVVPNKKAANSTVHNYHRPNKAYGYWFHVSVSSEVSPLLVRQLLLDAALKCKRVLDEPAPMIYFADLGTQPFKYMVFVHFPDYPRRFVALDELFLEIYHQFSQAGISPAAVTYEVDTRRARSPTVSVPSVAKTLREVSVFAPLSDPEISELADDLGLKDLRTGEVIVEEGMEGSSLFVIVTGIVVLRRRVSGEIRELERLGTGQCFGEMSLLTGEPRYATAQAITNVRVIEIPKDKFARIMANNAKLHDELAHIAVMRRARSEALQKALYHESSADGVSYRVARLKRSIREFFGNETS